MTQFSEETLPFKYLGVKISPRKMSKSDCTFLADKIVSRLRSWGTRTLSYAGRSQLVNSVLLNLHSYWASMFLITQKVIEQVMGICRSYLWSGQAYTSKVPPIAWDDVCRPKNEGGLGFKDSKAWNLAMLGKYVWSLATKEDNIWVKWVDHVYLKGRDWISYSPSTSASWYWRQLCAVKDKFRDGYAQNRWNLGSQKYTAASGYTWIKGERQRVPWAEFIWNRLNVPKCSFIAWLAMWGRLQTVTPPIY